MRLDALRRFSVVATPLAIVAVAALVQTTSARSAHADGEDKADFNERCASRIAITLLGRSATPAEQSSADPQAAIGAMLKTAEFHDRFASFVNAQFNGGPAEAPKDDPIYYLAHHVVSQNKPWTDLFLGAYDVRATADGASAEVLPAEAGLGYFRTKAWMDRYAGNEPTGLRLSAAYHIIQNTVGLTVPASVAIPGEDRTAAGRQAPGCRGCHFESWFALDKTASVLSRKVTAANGTISYNAAAVQPTQVLGKTIADDKDMVTTLVASDGFKVAQCRLVFKFLYGREENQCEAELFDRCVDALTEDKTITSAIAVVAKDPSFCQ